MPNLPVEVILSCDECVDTRHVHESTVVVYTLTGETECRGCGTRSVLGSWELLDLLEGLEG